ncbi:type II toxin-antitoxin system RnlA family toxin [Pseudomonas sp. P7758]|uniref:RNase LS family HEPN domain-containing protein n=1 Tax=Pseudomonas sp. P7758 TaxID=2738830 RepID=UPI0015A16A3A|nr:RNase LS family HEPN domain-containing protein [Pseudomonas sp. P7758]NWC70329.1 type II toxin-antitoxin system RnlA family toxin [Pseudomonas sp. P7758]
MSKSEAKKYKDLNLNFDSIAPCIERHGGTNPVLEKKNDKEQHLRFHVKDNVFLMKIFPVSGGVFSLGKAAGHCPDTFEHFANKIIEECVTPTPASLNVSLPRFPSEHVVPILDFLVEAGAQVSEVDGGALCKMYRVVGSLGDSLVIKHYNSGTLQFQGKYRQLAVIVSDYLGSVLSLDDVIKAQSKIYAVELTVQQVKDGLLAVLPAAHGFISDAVRIQLSSAFALAKIELPVEDYSCVALPALRGLEGFVKDLLIRGNLHPAKQSTFGDYFRDGKLGKDQATHVTANGGVALAEVIDECYAYYSAERHRTAHMDAPSTTSRILDFSTAKAIVNKVFELIEAASKRLMK